MSKPHLIDQNIMILKRFLLNDESYLSSYEIQLEACENKLKEYETFLKDEDKIKGVIPFGTLRHTMRDLIKQTLGTINDTRRIIQKANENLNLNPSDSQIHPIYHDINMIFMMIDQLINQKFELIQSQLKYLETHVPKSK